MLFACKIFGGDFSKFTPQILRAEPPAGTGFNFLLEPRVKKFAGA